MRPLQAQCLYGMSQLQKVVGNGSLAKQHAADATSLCREMGIKPCLVERQIISHSSIERKSCDPKAARKS